MILKGLFLALQVLVLDHLPLGPYGVVPMVYYLPWLASARKGKSRDLLVVAMLGLLQDALLFTLGIHLLAAVTALFLTDFFRPDPDEQRPVPVGLILTVGMAVYVVTAESLLGWGVLSLMDIVRRIAWHALMAAPAWLLVTWLAPQYLNRPGHASR